MVLQAYMDESMDTSGMFVLGGYIAPAESWAAFSREWQELLPLSSIQEDGRYRFKMSEMALSEHRMGNVAAFHTVINRHATMSIACVIDGVTLHRALNRLHGEIRKPDGEVEEIDLAALKAVWTDPFFFAFRALMDTFHMIRVENPELVPLDDIVDFWFDDTSKKGTITRAWDDYLDRRPTSYRAGYGAAPRFEDDEVHLPLQAADFRAWWVRKWAVELGPTNIDKGTYPFPTAASSIYNLILTVEEDQIVQMLAEAMGQAVQEIYAATGQV